MNVGKNIRKYRKKAKLTQLELANKVNMSRSYIADVERGRYNASLETLKSIANALFVPLSFIIEDEDPLIKRIHEFLDSLTENDEFSSKVLRDLDKRIFRLLENNKIEFNKKPDDLKRVILEIEDSDLLIEIYRNLISIRAKHYNGNVSELNETLNYSSLETSQQSESYHYPYIPEKISAGPPILAEAISEYNTEKISIPDNVMGKWARQKDIFIMRINGDSMDKIMPDNSIIAVKPVELSNLKNGDIVVYSDSHEYAVKRFYKHGDKVIFRPDSTDLSFTDYVTTIDNEELKIHGKVVLYIVELD